MSTIEIETKRGAMDLDVGENERAFIGLYNLLQTRLFQSEMDVGGIRDFLVAQSGSDPRKASAFAAAVAEIVEGGKPAEGWGIWAGEYARKFSAEKCMKDLKIYLVLSLAGMAGLGLSTRYLRDSALESAFDIALVLCSLLTLGGLYKGILLFLDWLYYKGGAWPSLDDGAS